MDADRVPRLELEDLVVELEPRAAVDEDVDLLLLVVGVPERHAVVRRDAGRKLTPEFSSSSGTRAVWNSRSSMPNFGAWSSTSLRKLSFV